MSEHTDPARDVEALAEELCRYDDSLHHMEATDDFPCWHCKAKARAVNESDWLAAYVARKQAEALREAADAIRDREGNALMRELLKLLCNDTARMAADWAESVCRDRADRLAGGEHRG